MRLVKVLAAMMFLAGTLSAQEWDSSFKLVAGLGNQAAADGAGATTQGGLSIEGVFPLPAGSGSLVFEAGYRKFLNTTAKDPSIPDPPPLPPSGTATFQGTDLGSSSQGWLASALWRRDIGPVGLYVEGGLRWSAFISRETWTQRTVTVDSTGGMSEVRVPRTGSFDHHGIGPIVGAGYRFDSLTSLDLHLSRQAVPTADGSTRTLTVFELGLGTHF